jgi:hypothetical protein
MASCFLFTVYFLPFLNRMISNLRQKEGRSYGQEFKEETHTKKNHTPSR